MDQRDGVAPSGLAEKPCGVVQGRSILHNLKIEHLSARLCDALITAQNQTIPPSQENIGSCGLKSAGLRKPTRTISSPYIREPLVAGGAIASPGGCLLGRAGGSERPIRTLPYADSSSVKGNTTVICYMSMDVREGGAKLVQEIALRSCWINFHSGRMKIHGL
jgi:hypothetical protein